MKHLLVCALTLMLFLTSARGQGVYEVLPSSTIRISGTSTISDWVVTSAKVGGHMTFLPANATRIGKVRDASVVLEVAGIKSEKGETMDNKMYAALKGDDFPQVVFTLAEAFNIDNAKGKALVRGNVSLAGITRPIAFDLDHETVADSFRFRGKKNLKLSDFQIEPPTAMFGQIETGDDIVLELDLLFGKQ